MRHMSEQVSHILQAWLTDNAAPNCLFTALLYFCYNIVRGGKRDYSIPKAIKLMSACVLCVTLN